jgi:hypothetical protein
VPDYRFYQLSRGRILSAEVHACADDEAARAAARTSLAAAAPVCEAIEIWCLARLVGLVGRAESGEAPRS